MPGYSTAVAAVHASLRLVTGFQALASLMPEGCKGLSAPKPQTAAENVRWHKPIQTTRHRKIELLKQVSCTALSKTSEKNSVFRLEGSHDPSAGFFLPIRRMPDQTAHSALQPVIVRINDVEAASFIGNSARALTRRGLFSFTAPPTRHKPTRPRDIATYGCCKGCRGQHTYGDKETSGRMFHSHLARAALWRGFFVSVRCIPDQTTLWCAVAAKVRTVACHRNIRVRTEPVPSSRCGLLLACGIVRVRR
jgi:hypothetical protein